MTYAPATISALRSYLIKAIPISGAKVGIVGDAAHAKRASYHNGKDRIVAYHRTRATDYSIRHDRDWQGLTNAASAIDIGNHDGLASLSRWLVDRCQANAPGTRDIREVIYAGMWRGKLTILRYDRDRGVASEPQPGEADDSHFFHSHVSFRRDSEKRDKIGIFKPYYEPEDEMDLFNSGMLLRRIQAGTPIYDEPGGAKIGEVGTGTAAAVVFRVVAQDKSGDWWLIDGGGEGKRMAWVKAV
jgi:hypothetical protein